MGETTFITVVPTKADAIAKTEELLVAGYVAKDIFAVINNNGAPAIVRGLLDAPVTEMDGDINHPYENFIGGDSEVREALIDMGFPDDEAARYYNEIIEGAILLYTNRQYDDLVHAESKTQ